jgi:hypothetical protein
VKRLVVAACLLALAACGNLPGTGSSSPKGPASAESVASNPSDFPGLQRCPESGSYDNYLKAEQAANSDQYDSDKKTWDDLKAGGADDSYVAAYAQNASDCGQFGNGTPTSKVAYAFAIRFKDSASAASSYSSTASAFHVSDSEVSQLKAAGATVTQGAATGLGDKSLVVSIAIGGASVDVAFWQNKQFEVATLAFDMSADAPAATKKINGRIR